ncbi:MAG: DPP IV N-terminal domain-containing protein [Fimbriimonas sp.]|nr:DPP IV N-terminal domain-containing protein [Fimbriimonas sp.]
MAFLSGSTDPLALPFPFQSARRLGVVALTVALLVIGSGLASADNLPKPVNHANWKLANRFTNEYIRQYVYSTSVTPHWINDTDVFWYSWRDSNGTKFYRVDPRQRSKRPLFDSARMASQLSELVHRPYDTTNLPITTLTFTKDGKAFRFVIDGVRYEYDLSTDKLKSVGKVGPNDPPDEVTPPPGRFGGQNGVRRGQRGQADNFRNLSPDKKAYVYAQDENLYFAEVSAEDKPIQLTKDGAKDYGFGAAAADAKEKRVRVNATWAPDSKAFSIERYDSRKVKDLYLVNSLALPRPQLVTYKYSMPGDIDVTQAELYVFHRDTKQFQRVKVEKWKDQQIFNVHWPENSEHLRFVRRDRLQRHLELCEIDMKLNALKTLLSEETESGFIGTQPIRYVKPDGDMIWWSERSGWGRYYLYSHDGHLKNEITSGPFRTDAIVELDAEKGQVWLTGYGREPDQNPTFAHMYRVNLDGTNLTLLDSGDADHVSVLSPKHHFQVDNSSRVDLAPKSVLRDEKGNVVMPLEEFDLSRLLSTGWKMPESFKVKAEDGVTDIYGVMWKPFDFDPHKKYPIVLNVYPGPQTESVTTAFSDNAGTQRLAQLGFIVVQIGNRGGNPKRSKAYDTFGYFNLRDYGLADKKAGVEQLGARFPWIDTDRVGIYGHSGGGFMTAAALLLPPYNDFFKVGVSSSGNHDNNIYNQNWSEQYHGLKEVSGPIRAATATTAVTGRTTPEDSEAIYDDFGLDNQDESMGESYENAVILDRILYPLNQDDPSQRRRRTNGQTTDSTTQTTDAKTVTTGETHFEIHVPTNAEIAANLKGKLLLVHGDMDNNVHYAGTYRLIDALIRAHKRFDYMLMPGKAHGYDDLQPYFTEMLYEYFCTHLLGDNYGEIADMNDKGE